MQRTNGNATQRALYLILAALSLLLALSYLQSLQAMRAAAHAALAVAWTLQAFGGTKGHRPKWYKFVSASAGVLFIALAALAIWNLV